ncbi:MAG: S8 family serine peptidase [Bdellovibrionota bacterium]
MKVFIHIILLLAIISGRQAIARIEPAQPGTSQSPTNDPLIGYQWGHWNSGQRVDHEIDDIHPMWIVADPKAQLGWTPEIDSGIDHDVVVAIVDSGLDIEHEDLNGAIALNEKECRSGKIPIGRKVSDLDGNGFEGDCMGWDFTAREQQGRFMSDDIGHGTHVAGILAARIGNGIGIAGISNRIKILPLKVYNSHKEAGSITGLKPISERVSDAIEYAISRGAQVVNLSLGWPIVSHTSKVKEVLDRALAHGVVIVAGAGNDQHGNLIYPCAHHGVICVGSIDMDANSSQFSNFGGQVDLVAPGGDIVSLYPMIKSSELFGMRGYEIKSGTSQATPFVSGTAALLKARDPGLTPAQIRAILVESSNPFLNLTNAMRMANMNNFKICLPDFKDLGQVRLDPRSGEFVFQIPIECHGKINPDNFSIRSKNHGVKLNGNFINDTGIIRLEVHGQADLATASSTLEIELRVDDRSYSHTLTLALDLMTDPGTQNFPVVFLEGSTNIGINNLATVNSYGLTNDVEYFTSLKTPSGLQVSLFRQDVNIIREIGSFEMPGVSKLLPDLPIMRVDLNLDGNQDYLVGGLLIDDKNEVTGIKYGYIGTDLKPLLPSHPYFDLVYEGMLPSWKNLQFLPIKLDDSIKLRVPVFFERGTIPKKDLDQDPFSFEKNLKKMRLYYLEPEVTGNGAIFRTRAFLNSATEKKIHEALGTGLKQDLEILAFLKQSREALEKGEVSLLVSRGNGALQTYFLLKVNGTDLGARRFELKEFDSRGMDLGSQMIEQALVLSPEDGVSNIATSITGIFSKTRARVLVVPPQAYGVSTPASLDIRDPGTMEKPLELIKAFVIGDDVVSFFEADSKLVVYGRYKNMEIYSEGPISRSSFLPGKLFSQRFSPVSVSVAGNTYAPGLFIDNSMVFGPNAITWTITDKGELITPARLAFEVPPECRVLNPALIDGKSYFTMLCQSKIGTDVDKDHLVIKRKRF